MSPHPNSPVRASIAALAVWAGLALGCGGESTAATLPERVTRDSSDSGAVIVEWRSEPSPIPLNEPFELEVRVLGPDGEPLEGAALTVDGWMPGHGHGMLRRPVSERRPDGSFRIAGMLFHMGGAWELRCQIGVREERGEFFAVRSEQVVFPVEL